MGHLPGPETRLAVQDPRQAWSKIAEDSVTARTAEGSQAFEHDLLSVDPTLRRGGLEARERTALLRVLDDETDRLNRLVRDLLTYARPMTPQAQPMELSAALRSAFDRARRRASATRGAPPPFAIVGGPEAVRGDPDLLGLAFERALETALEALAEGETLVVELARESLDGAGAVRVRVPGAGARPEGPETAHDVGFGHALIARAGSAHGGRLRETAGGLELTLPAE